MTQEFAEETNARELRDGAREGEWADLCVAVVDDSKVVRSMMELLLRAISVGEILLYDGVVPAKEGIMRSLPHLVISDYYMVPGTGLDLLSWLRASKDPELRDVPFVLMSGFDGCANASETYRDEIDGYMPKPVTKKLIEQNIVLAINARCQIDYGRRAAIC